MGLLTYDRLNEIILRSDFQNFSTFIETGTYTGRSIIPLSKQYLLKKFITIEIVDELYEYAKNQAKINHVNNIEFIKGDTIKELKMILNNIKDDFIICFLDAHSSPYEGEKAETIEKDSHKIINKKFLTKIQSFFNKKKYSLSTNIKKNKLSDYEVPLLEELKIINNYNKNFLIIIDDFDLFKKKLSFADWKNIDRKKIENIFGSRLLKSFDIPKKGLNGPQLVLKIKN